MPLVTVIISVFRRTCYLESAILSVLGQTLTDLDVLVTDDADSEEARRICALFSGDGRVRYRSNPQTLDVSLNFGAALREARGTYLCLLNDDDLLYPRMLEQLAAALDAHPEAVLAFGNHDVADAAGARLEDQTQLLLRRRGRIGLTPGLLPDSRRFSVRRNLMIGMGCLSRRSAVDPAWMVPEVGSAYDYWLAVKLGEQGPFYFIPEPVMAWRRHEDSATAQRAHPGLLSGGIYICETLLARPLPPPLEAYVKRKLAEFLRRRGLAYLEHGWSTAEARRCLYRSWRLAWSPPVFGRWLSTFLPVKRR